eukprot:TRINITY_DN32942_c0_g1_i1.p1 TRINITY_DN32942_c0_g1~~TRINITY_DN32942_c0_g1_i1.p1  ORF type:complete len:142 (+),score=60.69 TRINITY_DN32942_c0_g1_i1:15-440(+)
MLLLLVFLLSYFFFFKQKTAYEMLRSLVGSEMCIRDRCKGKLNEAMDLVNHYRTEEAIVKLQQGVEAVAELKERPGFLGLDFLDEFFFGADGYESLKAKIEDKIYVCLLYTSDAADEEDSVDLGGRRIIKKKKKQENVGIG